MKHNPQQDRFEHETDAGTAYVTLERDGNTVDFAYTFVPPAARGAGVGARLVRAARDWAEDQDLDIKASCGFAARVLQES